MPQRLDIICGVIKKIRVVEDTAATLIPTIPYGLTSKFHSSVEMNAQKSKAALINDNNSSSTTGYGWMKYKS